MQFDHSICKLCGGGGNTIRYRLRMANVVVCQHCGFHYTDYKDDEYAGLSAHSESPVLDDKAIRYIEEKLQSNPHRFDHHIATVLQHKTGGTLLDIGFGGLIVLDHYDRLVRYSHLISHTSCVDHVLRHAQ